jgi:hypothetical protein
VPAFLLIFVGTFVRRRGLMAEAFWVPAERLTYYVFFGAFILARQLDGETELKADLLPESSRS